MSEPTTPAPQSIQINLREMGLKYLGASQRTFDLAACTIGALRSQTERDYDEFARSVRFMPSQQHHLAFDAIRPTAESWLVRQLLGDALSLIVPLLEDARSVAALATWKADGGTEQTRLQQILQEDRQAFLRLSLDDKLKHVKEKFAISSPNEAFLNGYLKLGQALVRGGAVVEGDATDDKALVVRLPVVELQSATGEGATPGAMTGRLVEVQKRFAVGDKIEFRKEEALSLFANISIFISGIMGSLQAYVQKTLPAEVQPAS